MNGNASVSGFEGGIGRLKLLGGAANLLHAVQFAKVQPGGVLWQGFDLGVAQRSANGRGGSEQLRWCGDQSPGLLAKK